MPITSEDLHRKGYRPDGKGGLVRLPSAEWDTKHGRTVSKPAIHIPRPRIPNATEARYGDILLVRYQEHDVLYEALTFRLKSGAGYSPDWIVMQGMTIIACWECKGKKEFASHARSVLAFKTAANEWPMILWGWAKWTGKEWNETEILPK